MSRRRTGVRSTIVFAVLVSSCAFGYAFLFYLPTQRSLASLRDDMRQQFRFTRDADAAFVAFRDVERDLARTQSLVQSWRRNASRQQQLTAFLGDVTEIAGRSHVAIQRLTPQSVNRWKAIQQHLVETFVEGQYGNVFEFLRQVESFPATVWVESLELRSAGAEDGRLRCELVLGVFSENSGNSN